MTPLVETPSSVSQVPSSTAQSTDPHQTKIAADDPRLKLDRPRPRTLKKGAVLAVAGTVATLLLLSLMNALGSSGEPEAKKADEPATAPSLDQTFPISDTIKNAPDNAAPVFASMNLPAHGDRGAPARAPKLGPPLPGTLGRTMVTPGSDSEPSPQLAAAAAHHQERLEAYYKARAGGVLFSADQPTADETQSPSRPGPPGSIDQLLAT